jgi:hypothetical protein
MTTTNNPPRAAGCGGGGSPPTSHREAMDCAAADPSDPSSSNSKTTDAKDDGSFSSAGLAPSLTVNAFFSEVIFLCVFFLGVCLGREWDYGSWGIGDDSFRSGYLFEWSDCFVYFFFVNSE